MAPLQYLDPSSMPADPVKHGSFVHGVTVFAGGAPASHAAKRLPPQGTVLYTSEKLKPLSQDWATKPGTSDERVGRVGSFEHGVLRKAPGVLSRAAMYTPRNGGLISHGRVWSGGAPRDLPPRPAASTNKAIVLHEFPHLRPNMDGEALMKEGAEGERQGRRGSFECGDTHLYYHTPHTVDDADRYTARRHGQASNPIFSGGSPRRSRHATVC